MYVIAINNYAYIVPFIDSENERFLKTIFPSRKYTSIERKSRMPQIQGIKGEAVVVYCEPLITKEIGYHRLSLRVNKMMK